MNEYKYQLYCGNCGEVIGYTDHHFKVGEPLNAHFIVWPNGRQAEPGETIECACLKQQIRLRANPDYCDNCGGSGEVPCDGPVYPGEPHVASVGMEPCDKCN